MSDPEPVPAILTPNPRTVSLELLTREKFQPATTVNVLAAAWIQFMVRDWFSHGTSPKVNPWLIELRDDDPWPEHPMKIPRVPVLLRHYPQLRSALRGVDNAFTPWSRAVV